MMNLLRSWLKGAASDAPTARPMAAAGQTFNGVNDPAFLEFVRTGVTGGAPLENALRNPTVFRCCDLISNAIGMLPLLVKRRGPDGRETVDTRHPLYRLLMFKPNTWQTPHQFKSFMTFQMLTQGDAYAIISRAGNRITALTPIQSGRVVVEQSTRDWSVSYRVTGPNGASTVFQSGDVLHLSGLSADGVKGVSRLARAATAIQLANEAELSALKRFQLGAMIGGALHHPGKLGPEGREQLRASMDRNHSGSENAGRWMILEEGMKAEPFSVTAIDAQMDETRRRQIEEIGKVFAVPRPLLNVDDTSWGSGVEQLSMLFVSYTLNPWFKIWEDSLQLACLDESEWGNVILDFDDRQLLRGSMKDQAEFYAKALGSGGHKPWMEANEVREDLGLGVHQEGSGLVMAGQEGTQNEPRQTA